jgi:hypothetical protein
MVFSASNFAMEQMFPYGKKEQSFASLPPEPNGRNKSIGAPDRIPPIQQTPGIENVVTFAGGAFLNTPLRLDQEELASGRSPSLHKKDPWTTTFIHAWPAAPTPLAGHGETNEHRI